MTKKYKYNFNISRYGGEHIIGTIPLKVAEWWLDNKTADEFEEYIFSHDWNEDKDKLNESIPKEFQINEYWHDLDNIEHINGAEYASSNYLYVYEYKEHLKSSNIFHTQGKEIAEIPIEDVPIDSTSDPVQELIESKGTLKNDVIVYGQSFEKGGWDYETIETDKPFDISKLSVSVTKWDDMQIIDSIIYDGECLCNEGGDTWGKSQAFWIDD